MNAPEHEAERADVNAILAALFDIKVELVRIRRALEDDEEEEEEADS